MRLFIAVKFNEDIREALLNVQEQLKAANVSGNYTKPDNLHLTLAFIGEYADPDRVLDILAEAEFGEFEIRLNGAGSFSRLWWVGIDALPELKNTAAQIRHYLAEAGIPFDRKKFSPHVTLIREPDKPAVPDIVIPAASMRVREISLMRSDRGKKGMIYTEVGAVVSQDK